MKKIFLLSVFIISITSFTFADFQLDTSSGYFFNTDTYKEDKISRSFNGINLNITARYLFSRYIGLYLGGDFKAWFSANNDDYTKYFETAGMKAKFDEDIGFKLDLNFGIALAYPINSKFGIQSDIGLSNTVLGIETITGKVTYLGNSINTGVFIDKMSGMGIYGSILGRYEIMKNGYLSFGLRVDRKFTRKEKGEVVTGGVSAKFDDVPDFKSFTIAPFIGFLASFK
jgi:hypothetical protein